ncbi:MAG: replication-associated recombination protein A [Endomicrobium sp.]|jgi:putative ATPase|nr:replication-associated recombination protein A [Endomicrobium sp.]
MKQLGFFENLPVQKNKPLAARMIPRNFKEFFGQNDIVGEEKILRRLIEADSIRSVIFFGPPGTGKSALVRIIASKTQAYFQEVNAVTTGIAAIRGIIESAKSRARVLCRKTILVIDEIHHFNRSQQDVLLSDVEKGVVTLIGITTENPFFYINSAIISRSMVFEFKPLSEKSLLGILDLALKDKENGLGNHRIKMSEEAKKYLIFNVNGDARKLLNALEVGFLSATIDESSFRDFNVVVAQESIQKRPILYDRSGDAHYDHISAFIKSMRGTDPDAAVYWMAKMLVAGEDPLFIARKIIVCASEDVGMADPRALIVAISALSAVEFIGMPEAEIILAQAVIYVACAPKSNASYMAIKRALLEVRNGKVRDVPNHLKDSNLDSERLEHGREYRSPHSFEEHYVKQDYWSNPIELYIPTEKGYEREIRERLLGIRKKGNKT